MNVVLKQNQTIFDTQLNIITTRLTGGLYQGYKPRFPASA